jgi:hypothetical protein
VFSHTKTHVFWLPVYKYIEFLSKKVLTSYAVPPIFVKLCTSRSYNRKKSGSVGLRTCHVRILNLMMTIKKFDIKFLLQNYEIFPRTMLVLVLKSPNYTSPKCWWKGKIFLECWQLEAKHIKVDWFSLIFR